MKASFLVLILVSTFAYAKDKKQTMNDCIEVIAFDTLAEIDFKVTGRREGVGRANSPADYQHSPEAWAAFDLVMNEKSAVGKATRSYCASK
jgi:hypothetical protein